MNTKVAGYSDEEIAELSPEELEGLKEFDAEVTAENGDEDGASVDIVLEDTDEKSGDGANEATGADDNTDTDAGKDDDAEKSADQEADADNQAGDTEADTTGDADNGAEEDAKSSEEVSSTAPKPSFVAPTDLDEQIKSVQEKKDAVAQRFDDGELTGTEMREQMRELDNEEWNLQSQKIRSEVSSDNLQANFFAAADTFLASHKQYKPDTPLYNALNHEVKRLQRETSGSEFDPALITQAHENVEAQIRGLARTPASEEGNPDQKDTTAGKKGGTQKGLADIPPTLADIPASEATGDDGGEFAHLDKLSNDPERWEDYERALAALSPSEHERYMNS